MRKKKFSDKYERSTTNDTLHQLEGIYKSAGKIWSDDGGDEDAWETTKNLVVDCVGKDKQGLQFKGNPYVKVHPQKKCLIFLELTEKVSANERERYSRQRTWGGDDVDNAEAPPPKGAKQKKRTAPEDDPKPKKTRSTPKSKPDLSPDHVLNKAVRLENAANKAQSDSMSIEQAILENTRRKK